MTNAYVISDAKDFFCALCQVVIFRDGTYLTLKEVFESLDLTG